MPSEPRRRKRKPPRVRCSNCGSTNVTAITLGYLDGRLKAHPDGSVHVEEGEWVPYETSRIEEGSVQCANCSGSRFRVEGSPISDETSAHESGGP